MSWTRDSFAKKLKPGKFLPEFLRCSPTVQPYGAVPRAAELAPKDTLKLRRFEDHCVGQSLGARSVALGPPLVGYTVDRFIRLRDFFYVQLLSVLLLTKLWDSFVSSST